MNTTRFINVRAFAEGSNEIQVEIEGKEIWVPKVQIHPSSEVQEAPDEGTLVVNTFWARKHKLVA